MERVRFLTQRGARELTSLSPRQMARMTKDGRFPQLVPLGIGPRARKAYVESEILEWNAARVAARDASNAKPKGEQQDVPAVAAAAAPRVRKPPRRPDGGGHRVAP